MRLSFFSSDLFYRELCSTDLLGYNSNQTREIIEFQLHTKNLMTSTKISQTEHHFVKRFPLQY